jgi:hypothetical protein
MGSRKRPDVGARIDAIRQSFGAKPSQAARMAPAKSAAKPTTSHPQRQSSTHVGGSKQGQGAVTHIPSVGPQGGRTVTRSPLSRGLSQKNHGVALHAPSAGLAGGPTLPRPSLSKSLSQKNHGIATHAPTVTPQGGPTSASSLKGSLVRKNQGVAVRPGDLGLASGSDITSATEQFTRKPVAVAPLRDAALPSTSKEGTSETPAQGGGDTMVGEASMATDQPVEEARSSAGGMQESGDATKGHHDRKKKREG